MHMYEKILELVVLGANGRLDERTVIEIAKTIYIDLILVETVAKPLLTEVRADVEIALKLSRYVHSVCKDVPHDIGLKLVEIISEHFK